MQVRAMIACRLLVDGFYREPEALLFVERQRRKRLQDTISINGLNGLTHNNIV